MARKRSRSNDAFRDFAGYTHPHYTQVPDQFLDEHLRHLSGAEAKLMLVLFRQTLGWKKQSEKMSVPELAARSGIGDSTARRTVKALEEKGLVQVTRRTTKAGDPDANTYAIRWAQNERTPLVGSSQNERTVLPEEEDGPPRTKGQENRQASNIHDPPHTACEELALSFLRSIGYPKPSKAKRDRATSMLSDLAKDGYTLDELEAACEIAASLGARGPELIPHVIGQTPQTREEAADAERFAQAQTAASEHWHELAERFDALPAAERQKLLARARASSPILAKRAAEHPLVRGAALSLLDGDR